jgi:hypothetical protein
MAVGPWGLVAGGLVDGALGWSRPGPNVAANETPGSGLLPDETTRPGSCSDFAAVVRGSRFDASTSGSTVHARAAADVACVWRQLAATPCRSSDRADAPSGQLSVNRSCGHI